MKIKMILFDEECWRYAYMNEIKFYQKEYDYIFKYLFFDKLSKAVNIRFEDIKTSELFSKTYTNDIYLNNIYNYYPEAYKWLKENWGKGAFYNLVCYSNKQELKTIVNRLINIELIRNEK